MKGTEIHKETWWEAEMLDLKCILILIKVSLATPAPPSPHTQMFFNSEKGSSVFNILPAEAKSGHF